MLVILSCTNPGALPETVYIHSENVSDITYVSDRARVKVKAIGALTTSDFQSLRKVESVDPEVSSKLDTRSAPTINLSEVHVDMFT